MVNRMVKRYVIVGGVAGGASTATRLRRLDEFAEIIMLERGEFVSFANCGLPYYVGKIIETKEALELITPEVFLSRFNIDVRVHNEALSIDKEKKEVLVKNLETGEEYNLLYDKLVLAPGAEPLKPPIEGIDKVPIFTLRNIPDSVKIEEFISTNNPTSAVVVGAGYIGLEMVENLTHRGIRVIIVELLDQVLPTLDKDMGQIVNNEIVLNRLELILSDGVKSFDTNGNGTSKYLVYTQSGKKIETDMIVLSIGVRPESKLAKDCGLDLNQRGYIVVDEHMLTSDKDIYAVGDVVEITNQQTKQRTVVPLAGPANRQGRIAADNIAGRNSSYKGAIGTAVLKVFNQTVAQTGLTEKQLQNLDIEYDKVFVHPKTHAGYYPGAKPIALKLIFDLSNGKILGAQAVGGDGTEKRIDVIATVIYFGGSVSDLQELELCYAPPFGCARDCVNMAGFVASNVQSGDVKICHWHDADELEAKGAFIIDVRTPEKYESGHLSSSINIPLGQLRSRLNEIPKDKTIYLHCQVGFMAYIAQRILLHNGYDAVNFTGGYDTYLIATLKPGAHVGELEPYNNQSC